MRIDSRFRLSLIGLFFLATASGADPTTQPIASGGGEVGDVLRKWDAEGTAAGNIGDWYDNRDRGHSNLDLAPYPQVQKISYPDDARKTNRDWALQVMLLPNVVFGNSSTSAGVDSGGSNVRTYYVNPQGLQFLYAQYTHNNIYIYPEHCDHRPGHNGTPNHGDLYPTNTPFLITSQGSSGSDQPFMHALPYTLAAFRPEVKKKLVETGQLMPTVQMILRLSNRHLKDPGEYLTGKAHPSVFDGAWVDPLKMVKMAHDITLKTIPPVVQLRVLEEDPATLGVDYFEQGITEKLADTPVVVARIFRSATMSRRMVVSAENSIDLNQRPLKMTWTVLQGDATKIRITPRNASASIVEIVVDYPERRSVQPGSALESNRVDIGVFANNGAYFSAPGFVTWFSLDNEARTYDQAGKLLEIGYGMGEPLLSVGNWPAFFDLPKPDAASRDSASSPQAGAALASGSKLLQSRFTDAQRADLKKAGDEYAPAFAAIAAAEQKRKDAEADAKKADKDAKPAVDAALKAANAAHQTAVEQAEMVLTRPRDALKQGAKAFVESALNDLAADPMLWKDHVAEFSTGDDARTKSIVANAFQSLVALGVAGAQNEWTPIRAGSTPVQERLTQFERIQIQRFNDQFIADIALRGVVNAAWRENFIDFRLAAPKSWRDVYHYDDRGQRTGWTRYAAGQSPGEFNADGLLIVEKDSSGHPTKLQSVKYERQREARFPLKQVLGDVKTEASQKHFPCGCRR